MSYSTERSTALTDRALVSLFAGIGGFEVAARAIGCHPTLLCENDEVAQEVLRARFPAVSLKSDIRDLKHLPKKTWMVTAGFPCQDLSSVGQKNGIKGARSSLIDEVFRLLETENPDWVVLENVMFMLHLGKGSAMEHVIGGLEDLGFNWAYRLLNTAEFGLPQRRRRVYFVASRKHDAAAAMFLDDTGKRVPVSPRCNGSTSYGFYWTEGTYATGIMENGVPPLKIGSTIGIPSPPAIMLNDGAVGTPSIGDAERLQGFRKGWTKPAENLGRESLRWKLVGNAVSVPVARKVMWAVVSAESIGQQVLSVATEMENGFSKWPNAAFGSNGRRFAMPNSWFPGMRRHAPIHDFLSESLRPLSEKASVGFLRRAKKGRLRFPDGFLDRLNDHAVAMAASSKG